MKKTLLTGATGYVGAHLLKALESEQKSIVCLVRQPRHLLGRVGAATQVVKGDVFDPESLEAAMVGVSTAYYLVHSMGGNDPFEKMDRIAAENFAKAAEKMGVEKIVYLGGLARSNDALSAHLKSRQEVGDILRSYKTQVIEFRASIIIGAGSLSFEMIRALTERLPVMITPKWVSQKAQPISIEDVILYLKKANEMNFQSNLIFEIGGEEQVSYGEIMKEYARQKKLRRYMIPVPFLTPRLSSLWLGLVTPLYANVGRKLVDSMIYETTVRDHSAEETFGFRPKGTSAAIEQAIKIEDLEMATARWFGAISSSGRSAKWGGLRFGSRLVDARVIKVKSSKEAAFRPIETIGGRVGWYFADWLWKLRGLIDLLLGGVGTRRGRTHPSKLYIGDVIDWWRIENVVPHSLLLLRAEMKVPGRAWLQFEVIEEGDHTVIQQTALFDPKGLGGLLYWYLLYPVHYYIFNGMIKNIGKIAEAKR